jgi:AcrR family transcriptional regulator
MRDLAARLSMRAPSLYEYFPSKDAIYDTMFAAGYEALRERMRGMPGDDVRGALIAVVREFVAFCSEDRERYQLMFQYAIPGWEPSLEAYAVSVALYEDMRTTFAELGIVTQQDLDLWTALSNGLAAQQVANDPGGDRWMQLTEAAVDMYLAHLKQR